MVILAYRDSKFSFSDQEIRFFALENSKFHKNDQMGASNESSEGTGGSKTLNM